MKDRLSTTEKIKIELLRRGMTQAELAKELHVEEATLSRRMTANSWKVIEIFYMKHKMGFDL